MDIALVNGILSHFKFTDILVAFAAATLIFACSCEKRPRFALRAAGCTAALLLLCQVFAVLYHGNIVQEAFFSAILISLMIVALLFCYKESVWNMLFYFGSGFMCWYIADRTALIIASCCRTMPMLAPFFVEHSLSHMAFYIATLALLYFVVYMTAGCTMHELKGGQIPAVNAILLMLVVSILTPIFYFESSLISGLSLFYYTLLNVGEVIYYISMLLVMTFMLYSANETATHHLQEALWQKEQAQYRLVKENIETINIKCHDLKHQIQNLRDEKLVDPAYLDEMEKSISVYNSAIRSGNETLDVVLTDKRLHCSANAIQFTCMADGNRLAFMEVMDIYSLFGNAIDNAIEYVSKQAENLRFIHLSVRANNGLLLIHIENPFSGELALNDGLPVTTKGDNMCHGYGMRSIRRIVTKYGGEFTVSAEDELFQLDIMLPIPQADAAKTDAL